MKLQEINENINNAIREANRLRKIADSLDESKPDELYDSLYSASCALDDTAILCRKLLDNTTIVC